MENGLQGCCGLSILIGADSVRQIQARRRCCWPALRRPNGDKDMWKRKEDEVSPAPEHSLTGSPMTPAPSAPQRPTETPRSEPLRSAEVANIGKSVVVKGELSGSEDLVIDGEVEGS